MIKYLPKKKYIVLVPFSEHKVGEVFLSSGRSCLDPCYGCLGRGSNGGCLSNLIASAIVAEYEEEQVGFCLQSILED